MTLDEMSARLKELEDAQRLENDAVATAQKNILVRTGRILELKRALADREASAQED